MSMNEAAIRAFGFLLMSLLISGIVQAQRTWGQETVDRSPRLLLDTEFGSATQLGYKFPSTAFGPSVEIPISRRFELQASAAYSPDRKFITNDGRSVRVGGTAIVWATQRFGVTSNIHQSWLWTSQFDKSAAHPALGVVLRNEWLGPGRFYLSYVLPTGCVWATTNNPCQIQSNRTQGLQIGQETRQLSHFRFGLQAGIYHFCDQSNPYQPSAGRNCHLAVTLLTNFRFEFHVKRAAARSPSY